MMVRRIALTVWCFLAVAPAYAANHVRVVLDVSKSMEKNDERRLATLSTALLHDLANPDATHGDTFEVIPFDPAVRKWVPPAAFPMGVGARLVGGSARRNPFVRALTTLKYDARYTYFYPTLAATIADFEGTPRETGDRRVIVLVTDGVPEPGTRAEEERRLHAELVPRLRATGARLYVLAFGEEATRERSFFDALVAGGLGAVIVDEHGTGLLESMIEIFSNSFGYTYERPVAQRQTTELDLQGGQNPTEVAVVQFWLSPTAKPFQVRPAPNTPVPAQRTQEKGAGYALAWILQPRPGNYTVMSDQAPGRVTVLRPTRLQMAVRPGREGVRPEYTIARTPFPLDVIVAPAAGTPGDPGEVDLSYVVCMPRGRSGLVCGNPLPPIRAAGTAEAGGRVYQIQPVFVVDTEPDAEFYAGEIRITARRRDADVARLVHRVSVYPFVELTVTPPILTIPSDRVALGPGGQGCAEFRLTVTGGRLPHPANPAYAVRAALPPNVTGTPQFAGAAFNLDGARLDIESNPQPVPGPWYSGRALTRDALLAPHLLCVQMGRPRAGDTTRPAMMTLGVHLAEPPYDGYAIAPRPVSIGVLVAPPGWIDRAAPLVLLLALTTTMLLLWYSRSRPFVATDLRCVLTPAGTESAATEQALAPGAWLTRVLGFPVRHPISTQNGAVIGWIRPVSEELYDLQLARGVTLQGGLAHALRTRHTYVANTREGQIAIRVEFT